MPAVELKPIELDILNILNRSRSEWVPVANVYGGLRTSYGNSPAAAKTMQRALRRLQDASLAECMGQGSARKWRSCGGEVVAAANIANIDLAVALVQLEKLASHQLPANALASLRSHCDAARRLLNTHPTYSRFMDGRAWAGKTALIDSGFPFVPPPLDPAVMQPVTDALYRGHALRLTYRNGGLASGTEASYEVTPLALIERGKILYLISCRRSSRKTQFRRYFHRLDRIVQATVSDNPADRDPAFDLDRFIQEDHALLFFPEAPEKITLRVREEGFRSNLRDYQLAVDQIIQETDEGFLLTATVRPSLTFKQFLLGYATHAEVIEPLQLRSEIAAFLTRAQASYREPAS